MAFDGITVAGLVHGLKNTIEGGKIAKIAQPEKDELLFTIKNYKDSYRLLVSASASLPLLYLTEGNKPSPLTAPNFCMLLRKHIGNAKILKVSQPGLERIVVFELEHLDELGDLCRKKLIVELMGKHSNIIFCREDGIILDSIKHISAQISSVREVLPGREYFIPRTTDKADPLTVSEEVFMDKVCSAPMPVFKALYTTLTGISPVMGVELCHLASIDSDLPANGLSKAERTHLYHTLRRTMEDIQNGNFSPNIVYEGMDKGANGPSFGQDQNGSSPDWMDGEPVGFAVLPLTCYEGKNYSVRPFSSVSSMLETYYASKNTITRIRQRSSDLRRIVQTALDRNLKKYDLQKKQLKDTEKRERYKIYGELLNAYGYGIEEGATGFTCLDHHTGKEVTIPLDPQLNAQKNAQRYFERYNKLKRTFDALNALTVETKREIEHLESISSALDIALQEADLVQIREELMEYGYIKKRHPGGKRPKIVSKPFHYLSSDGFHIYVGKNNYQNEELTFKLATGNDWWFHAKGMPGSHVIVKTEGKELPDRVFEEAGALAAYYSRGRDSEKVEIDYIQKKSVKKVAGAAPGFVIYHTNYSMVAAPSCRLKELT